MIAGTFIASIKSKGYEEKSARTKAVTKAAIVALIGLLIVYGGLLYLGATGSGMFDSSMDQTALLVAAGGKMYRAALEPLLWVLEFYGLPDHYHWCHYYHCSADGNINAWQTETQDLYFDLRCARFPAGYHGCCKGYHIYLPCVCPDLSHCDHSYPVGLRQKTGAQSRCMEGHCPDGSLIGIYEAVVTMNGSNITNIHIPALESLYAALPLSSYGFAWLLPCIIGFIVGAVIVKASGKGAYPMLEKSNEQ